MKVLIIGAGRRGLRLARHLIEERTHVTFLDSSDERCQSAISRLDCLAVCGSATSFESLIEAGVKESDYVIAVTDSDEVNLVSCGMISVAFPRVKQTIAAIRGITYLSSQDENRPILGISHIVNPDQETSVRILDVIRSGLYSDTITFPNTNFLLFTMNVSKDSPFASKNLMEANKHLNGRFVVTGVYRRGKAFVPSGNTLIRPGDTIAVISDNDETLSILHKAGVLSSYKIPGRIVIVGASQVTKYLLNQFTPQERKRVILLEKSSEKANEFASLFSDLLVINGAVTEESLWEEERLNEADLIISLTENDELNIITASYAKKVGISRSIALIKTNVNYLQFARNLDIDAPISTTDVTVDTIVKHLRGKGVTSLHTLFDGKIEVYEYLVTDEFCFVNKALKDVDMKGHMIVAGVTRGDASFVPDGSYVFKSGDTLLLTVAHEKSEFAMEILGK